ncbi:MAG: hypothetical protein RI907_3495 [Pseudomonadota bacterium]|jgi:hypothetical protein
MAHPRIHNATPFAFSSVFATDLSGQPLFVPLLKASFRIAPDGSLSVADPQAPVLLAGAWWGDPETTSLRAEPEAIAPKPGTDVVLMGHACPQRPGDTDVHVGLRVGPLSKVARVFGDRHWVRRAGFAVRTEPEPFERVPLRWELAFGGWDRQAEDPSRHRGELRNPVGRGFWNSWPDGASRLPLPNIEDPKNLISSFDDRPQPMGFGFIGMHWAPRVQWGGTCDGAWLTNRMPLPPLDLDPRFWQGVMPDQVVNPHLLGHEPLVVVGTRPGEALQTRLPGSGQPPVFDVVRRPSGHEQLTGRLDTVIVDTDSMTLSMLWRAAMPVAHVPADVAEVHVRWPGGFWADPPLPSGAQG